LKRLTHLIERVRALLPRGGAISAELWEQRHRLILILLYVHAVGLACLGVIEGRDVEDSLLQAAVVVGAALLAGVARCGQRARALIATLGLLGSSAMLVHLSNGFIEMHVDFFVIIVIVTLYADWLPFLLAIGYVVAEHISVAALDSTMTDDYPQFSSEPLLWLVVHVGFILVAMAAGLIHWRIDEAAHLDEAAEARAREQHELLLKERKARAITEDTLRAREQLLTILSRDLKDPLGAIKGNAQLLQRHVGVQVPTDPDRVRAGLLRIDASATWMAELLEELQDVTRLEIGDIPPLQRQPTDLLAIARRGAADFQKTTLAHEIRVASPEATMIGTWDPSRLERAIANLVLRAMLRSPDGGTIDVAIDLDEASDTPAARISVRSRSFVATDGAIPTGLDRFHHVAGAAGPEIGVAVARQIFEQHGGRVDEAIDDGEGSIVMAHVPIQPASPATSLAR
jgi:signal transduction histidine kinase